MTAHKKAAGGGSIVKTISVLIILAGNPIVQQTMPVLALALGYVAGVVL
ncbi:MAG: hypothetical protein RBR82_14640 [Pseudomonas sp.]|nr:hypothetical protein [Pseudomonas sp.]